MLQKIEKEVKEMKKEIVGCLVRDTKKEYSGDVGVVSDIRHFKNTDKTYAVVIWGENSIHGNGAIRNYSPDAVGTRLEILE